ncbi:MAG: hypothetical protein RL272_1019 [Candidatus Parcubacteria bacterium]|jgi:hypothetical protein
MTVTFRARRWSEEDLAKRICRLLYGDDRVWKEDGGSRRWHIGTANDAWLHPKGDDVFVLHCRYGTAERLAALAVMLEWRIGLEILKDAP